MLRSVLIVISFIHVYFFGTFLFLTKSQHISVWTAIWSTYKGVQYDWPISTNLENIYIFHLNSTVSNFLKILSVLELLSAMA